MPATMKVITPRPHAALGNYVDDMVYHISEVDNNERIITNRRSPANVAIHLIVGDNNCPRTIDINDIYNNGIHHKIFGCPFPDCSEKLARRALIPRHVELKHEAKVSTYADYMALERAALCRGAKKTRRLQAQAVSTGPVTRSGAANAQQALPAVIPDTVLHPAPVYDPAQDFDTSMIDPALLDPALNPQAAPDDSAPDFVHMPDGKILMDYEVYKNHLFQQFLFGQAAAAATQQIQAQASLPPLPTPIPSSPQLAHQPEQAPYNPTEDLPHGQHKFAQYDPAQYDDVQADQYPFGDQHHNDLNSDQPPSDYHESLYDYSLSAPNSAVAEDNGDVDMMDPDFDIRAFVNAPVATDNLDFDPAPVDYQSHNDFEMGQCFDFDNLSASRDNAPVVTDHDSDPNPSSYAASQQEIDGVLNFGHSKSAPMNTISAAYQSTPEDEDHDDDDEDDDGDGDGDYVL